MVNIGSFFFVADNSGVKIIKSVNNLTRKTNKIFIGDLIVGVVKEIQSNSKITYSNIVYSIIIRLKKNTSKSKKYNMCFNDNAAVLVNKNLNLIGSRVIGSLPKFLKEKNYLKLHTLTLDLV